MINNSIDGAIKRLDTLNNYPKVMSNLGISSDKAQKSINKMSDKLSGLPTTLDEGALAVQRFTSANSDIEKSTDYFLALNNAILAGGASTDIQSSALEQLSQAYAKGKPDMMEWRSLMTAMPAQLKQVATAMGYISTDQLGQDLREGNVSMEKFMDTIVKLNNEGVNGFQSFEEQARNSTGGIATSITVAKTQVVKGVADIIKAIDDFLKNEGFGGISEIISNAGKRTKEVLDLVAENVPNIVKILKQIAPAIVSIVAGITALKVEMIAVQAIHFFSKIAGHIGTVLSLTKSIKSVKDAFTLLGMAFNTNPIGIIIGLIAGLVAGFVYLWNNCEAFRDFWIGLWETIKSVFEVAWNTIKDFFAKTIPEAFQKLVDKLSEIGNNIKTFFESLWNNIVSFFTETIPNAFKKLLNKTSKISNDIKKLFENLWKGIISFFTNTIPKWIENVIKWFSDLPYNIGYAIGQIIGHIIKFGLDIWNWITVELPLIIEGIIQWFSQLPGRIAEWLVSTYNNILQWATDIYINVIQWISNTITGVITFFSELPGKIYEFLLQIIANILEWGMNIYQTATSWISNMINTIVDWFARLPGRIWTWLSNAIANVSKFAINIAQKGKEAAVNLFNNIINTIKELPDRMLEIGKNIVEGLWNGIKNAGDWIKNKVGEFAKGILDGMKDALGIHSPSTLFRDEIGKFIPSGVGVGIEANTDEALRAIREMDKEIVSEMNKAVSIETGSINANATVKANNSMMTVINANVSLDGTVELEGEKAGRLLAKPVMKMIRTGGAYAN